MGIPKRSKCVAALVGCCAILQVQVPVQAASYQKPTPPWQIASNQPTGGSILGPTAAIGTQHRRKTGSAIISNSLWGNLMLEIAFDRDPVLNKLGAYTKLLKVGAMTGMYAVSMGTLYQTIYATAVLNPPPPHQDSSAPGIGGIVFSSVAILTFTSRALIGHELTSRIHRRQMEIRDNLESALSRLADTHCQDQVATGQLNELIGERASGEWMQIWRSIHLSTEARRIGMDVPDGGKLMATTATAQGGL